MIPLLAATAATSLATAVWQAVLLVWIVALAFRFLPAVSAAARSLIWTAAFTIAFLLHFTPHTSNPGPETPALHVAPVWTVALTTLWLLLSLTRATQLGFSALALHRLSRNATAVASQQSPRHYTLCTSPEVDRPCVIGFFRPRILLPPSLHATLTPAELHQILLHETEHLRRRDDWVNLFQKLALVLFPLNPALLWIERRLCLERELACDDCVLHATGAPKAYATCLTSLAEHTFLRRCATLSLGIVGVTGPARESELSRRVHRILRPQETLSGRSTVVLIAALLIVLAGGALKLTRAPQFISFVPAQEAPASQAADVNFVAPQSRASSPQASFVSAAMHVTANRVSRLPGKTRRPRQSRVFTRKPLAGTRFRTVKADLNIATQTPRLILTRTPAAQDFFNYVPAVAIATPNGWLIIQL